MPRVAWTVVGNFPGSLTRVPARPVALKTWQAPSRAAMVRSPSLVLLPPAPPDASLPLRPVGNPQVRARRVPVRRRDPLRALDVGRQGKGGHGGTETRFPAQALQREEISDAAPRNRNVATSERKLHGARSFRPVPRTNVCLSSDNGNQLKREISITSPRKGRPEVTLEVPTEDTKIYTRGKKTGVAHRARGLHAEPATHGCNASTVPSSCALAYTPSFLSHGAWCILIPILEEYRFETCRRSTISKNLEAACQCMQDSWYAHAIVYTSLGIPRRIICQRDGKIYVE